MALAPDLIRSWNTAGWSLNCPRAWANKLHCWARADGEMVVVTDTTSEHLQGAGSPRCAFSSNSSRHAASSRSERDNFPICTWWYDRPAQQGYEMRLIDDEPSRRWTTRLRSCCCRKCQLSQRPDARHGFGDRVGARARARSRLHLGLGARAAGAQPVDPNGANAAFARAAPKVHLNGGPGSPAFICGPAPQ